MSERFDKHVMALILIIVAAASTHWPETIPVIKGLGWDGATLGKVAMTFFDDSKPFLDPYRVSRIGPSVITAYTMKWFDMTGDEDDVIFVFRVMNGMCLVAASYFWAGIVRTLGISRRGGWLGFIGLFGSFAALKMAWYCPVLTDMPALMLTVALLFFHLRRNFVGVLATAILAAFTWPTTFYAALLLFLFPKIPPHLTPEQVRFSKPVGALAGALFGELVIYQLFKADAELHGAVVPHLQNGWPSLFWLSAIVAGLFVAGGTMPLFRSLACVRLDDVRSLLTRWFVVRVALAAGVFYEVRAVYERLAGRSNKLAGDFIVTRLIYESTQRPFVFLVAHVIYLGPVVLLAVLVWPMAARAVHDHGYSLVGLCLGLVVLLLGSESRSMMTVVPVMVAFTVLAVDARGGFNGRKVWLVGAWALFVSRIWMPVDGAALMTKHQLAFPAQRYFMNFGPWIGDNAFFIWIALTAVTGLMLLWLLDAFRDPPAVSAATVPP